ILRVGSIVVHRKALDRELVARQLLRAETDGLGGDALADRGEVGRGIGVALDVDADGDLDRFLHRSRQPPPCCSSTFITGWISQIVPRLLPTSSGCSGSSIVQPSMRRRVCSRAKRSNVCSVHESCLARTRGVTSTTTLLVARSSVGWAASHMWKSKSSAEWQLGDSGPSWRAINR